MNTGLLSDTIAAITAEKTGIIRVLVVDDHHVVREGLRRMLELESSIQVVGEARSGCGKQPITPTAPATIKV
nr:hypothetical protein [Dehalococcoidia bacterium]